MTFDGNDYTVIGLSLEFVGGYLLARGFLRSVSFETTRMHLGSNPFLIRNLIRSHYEARVGFSCFLLGLIGALVGTVRSAQAGQTGLMKDSLYLFLVSVVVGAAVLASGLPMLADRAARRRYMPILREHQREAFHAVSRILADGQSGARQITQARAMLNQVATLLDEPRADGETDAAMIERLRRHYGSP